MTNTYYAKLITGERTISSDWKRGKVAKRCNVFPTVWAAILGCKGERVTTWRYTVGNFGRREAEYACPTCKALKDHFDSLSPVDRQDALAYAQQAAGVDDYRTARVKLVNGVPTIVQP